MSQPPNMDALAAKMEQMGIPPTQIDAMLRDPTARQQLSQVAHLARLDTSSLRTDVYDEAGIEERFKLDMDAATKAYELEKSRPLRKPAPLSRFRIIASLNAACEEVLRSQGEGSPLIYTSYLGLPKSFSSRPVNELERINIKEMFVSKTHKGRYLVCRIVSRPNLKVGVSFAVEDPDGRTENFSIYNYPLHGIETGPDLDALFPLGSILVVREPTFKMNQSNSGPLLRVDSPSDIDFVTPSNPLVSSIRWSFPDPAPVVPQNFDFKALGNSYFKSKKYLLAVKAYTDGLDSTTWLEEQLLLRLNRAQAHALIGNFYQARQDASEVLSLLQDGVTAPQQTEEKAILRRSRAYEGLRQFALASESYEQLLKVSPDSTEAKAGISRVNKILRQSSTGEYDWLELSRVSEDLSTSQNVLAGDFVGSVEVKELSGRGGGRAVFAKKAIRPGELLLVETAFSVGRPSVDKRRMVMAFNLVDRSAVDEQRLNLVENIVAKVMDDPSSLSDLHGLYGGSSYPASSTPSLETQAQVPSTAAANLDISRIEGIVTVNCFGGSAVPEEMESTRGSTNLFIRSSLFNHRCTANATWHTYNNVMVIRARTAIAAGEEIFLSYCTVGVDRLAKIVEQHLGKNGCNCPLCDFDRLEGKASVEKRKKLLEDQFLPLKSRLATTPMPSPAHSRLVQQLERLVETISKTYSPSRPQQFRIELSDPLHCLADSQQFQTSDAIRRRSVELTIRSHRVRDGLITTQGNNITVKQASIELGGDSVATLLVCARRYAFRNDPHDNETALKWIKAAMDLEKLMSGGGYAVFRFKHEKTIKHFGLDHLVDALRP